MSRTEQSILQYVDELVVRYPVLEVNRKEIVAAYQILEAAYAAGGQLLIAGNGGSCADANHIVGELMKGFCNPRRVSAEFADTLCKVDPVRGAQLADKLQGALPAIALDNHNALNTAFNNDVDGSLTYAQQIMGYGKAGDVFLGISTSGNAENVMMAAVTAKAKGLKVLGLTGKKGGKLAGIAYVCIRVDETETYKVQELHLPIYHCLCLMLEKRFFG